MQKSDPNELKLWEEFEKLVLELIFEKERWEARHGGFSAVTVMYSVASEEFKQKTFDEALSAFCLFFESLFLLSNLFIEWIFFSFSFLLLFFKKI